MKDSANCRGKLENLENTKLSCVDVCCSDKIAPASYQEKDPVTALQDIENQATGTGHVVLSISGMICTGCETKLNRTLATIPAVRQLWPSPL